MAKIEFGQSYCQVEGTLVPSSEFTLAPDDGVVFSHHTLCGLGRTHLEPWSKGSFSIAPSPGCRCVLMRSKRARARRAFGGPSRRGSRTTDTGRARFLVREHFFPGRDRQYRFLHG